MRKWSIVCVYIPIFIYIFICSMKTTKKKYEKVQIALNMAIQGVS